MMKGIRMTSPTAHLLVRRPVRADRLARGLVVAALIGAAGLWALALASASSPSRSGPAAASRVAVVVDAAGRPRAALARARVIGGRDSAVRVPRTAAEADADVRYFAALGYGRVVVAGSLASEAAQAAGRAYRRTRFVVR
jgi:hypothetical protein